VTSSPRWIDDAAGLEDVLAAAVREPTYALDTEFHRERTYYPQLALLQLCWAGQTALIDPLAVDVAPLAALLDGPGLAILHAAQQDLEVLGRACGTIPSRLFDTQLAAGFLGHATPSLANLVSAELGIQVPKADRLSDWLRRPLSHDQLTYAAADVDHLHELHARLAAELDELGRLEWALAECEELRVRPTGPGQPEDAWLRLKDLRTLRGRARNVARAVAAWRERRAARQDLPTRFILSDLALLGIAQRPPSNRDQLRAIRGVEERHLRAPLGDELLAAVAAGQADTAMLRTDEGGPDLERRLRPAITLVSAWVAQLAKDQRLDTSLLATRADLTDLLGGAPHARLASGWRAEVLGDDVKRLVAGEAALAFDPEGQLRLLRLD
jgi:ribonuclease D